MVKWRESGRERDARIWGPVDRLLDEGRLRQARNEVRGLRAEEGPATAAGAAVRDRLTAAGARLDADLARLHALDASRDPVAFHAVLDRIRGYCVDDPEVNELSRWLRGSLRDPMLRARVGPLADWIVEVDATAGPRADRLLRLGLGAALGIGCLAILLLGASVGEGVVPDSPGGRAMVIVVFLLIGVAFMAPPVLLAGWLGRRDSMGFVTGMPALVSWGALTSAVLGLGFNPVVGVLGAVISIASVVAGVRWHRAHLLGEWNRFVAGATRVLDGEPGRPGEWAGGVLLLHRVSPHNPLRGGGRRKCTVGPVREPHRTETVELDGASRLSGGEWIAVDASETVVAVAPSLMRRVAGRAGAGAVPGLGAPGAEGA
ncbi:hypothetical protein [Corynebacterium sphenisci]|uniref:hypothetical protein n=1 Tax=Corynebacterium sphenisci TaxID=191493 RepID=UPI0026DED3AF|nr:hypothetical protein [Corynebacterium sphenisci]MDO5731728.1 hypothetical protein [Corynebacterium sphenisci]